MANRTFNRTLNVVSYKQFDSQWADEITSCGGTMKAEGCAITSGAMIFNITPLQHLNELKPGNDCPYNWSAAASKHGKTAKRYSGTFDQLKSTIFDHIIYRGIPVIARVQGSNTHFIVIKGFLGTLAVDPDGALYYTDITPSMFIVNDPGSSYNVTLKDTLDSPKYDVLNRLDVFE